MMQEQTLHRLKQLRIVTRNYSALRGLQCVPFGIFFLMIAIFQLGWLHLPPQWSSNPISIAFCIFLVCLILYSVIGSYYQRNFGYVEQVKPSKLNLTLMWLAIFVLAEVAVHVDSTMDWPISASGLVLALVLFTVWWRTNAFRTHVLIIAILTGLISLLPLLGFPALAKIFIPFHVGYVLVLGLFLSVGGICDHLILTRTFRGVRRGYHDKAI